MIRKKIAVQTVVFCIAVNRISFWLAHAHPILACACASHFGLRVRISFWSAHAHLILACTCASHFALRMRISFWPAHAHLILACAYAYHFPGTGSRAQIDSRSLIKKFSKRLLLNFADCVRFIAYFLSNVLLFENIQSIAQDSV